MRVLLETVNPYLAINFVLKTSSDFYACCMYVSVLKTRSYQGSKQYEPDQTAPLGAV